RSPLGGELETHDVALHTALDTLVAEGAALRRGALDLAVGGDHEVDDELAAETRRAVQLLLVAGAEHAGARLDDAIDLFLRQAVEVAGGVFHLHGDCLRRRAGAARADARAAGSLLAGVDRSLVRHEVTVD